MAILPADEMTDGGNVTIGAAIVVVPFRAAIHQNIRILIGTPLPTDPHIPRTGIPIPIAIRANRTVDTAIAAYRSTMGTRTDSRKDKRTLATAIPTILSATVAIDQPTVVTTGDTGRKRSTRTYTAKGSGRDTKKATATLAQMAVTGNAAAAASRGRSREHFSLNRR